MTLNAAIVANLIGIAAVAAWMLAQVFPLRRAVRLRNALLAGADAVTDFDWRPGDAPGVFQQETRPPSPVFAEAIAQIDLETCASDWDRALRIAEHLASHAHDRGAIQADLSTTYARILDGYGYCADFVKVFLGLAHAAGLCARQWAFSFDGFGGHGHTIVEIFDRARDKWLFLDVYNNFHVRDAHTMAPLGALEFRRTLLNGRPNIVFQPNGAGRPGYPLMDKLLAYYRAGLGEWYLIGGNAVFTYEAHPLVHWTSRFSGSLGQVAATLVGVHPRIQVLRTSENRAKVQRLAAFGHRFRVTSAAFSVLVLLLIVQLAVYATSVR